VLHYLHRRHVRVPWCRSCVASFNWLLGADTQPQIAGSQRLQPDESPTKTVSISPLQSLAVPAQFRDLSIGKSRKQTFAEGNQYLAVAVNIAATAGIGERRLDGGLIETNALYACPLNTKE
jgi:hypothetical protein